MSSGALRWVLISFLLLWAPVTLAEGNSAHGQSRAEAAREFAYRYLSLWSAPNHQALAAAPSLYGETVKFHGRVRTIRSVLAEKRRFAKRWPKRTYRYRPETTRVACEARGARCTTWSLFDFSAAHEKQGRRSTGLGEHRLEISFAGRNPIIATETSRVLRRGPPSS